MVYILQGWDYFTPPELVDIKKIAAFLAELAHNLYGAI
jgi:hypothetical protein